jgi:hypothetical protein
MEVMCFGNFDPGSKNDELVTLRKDGIVMFSAAKVKNNGNNRNNMIIKMLILVRVNYRNNYTFS